MTYKDTTFCTAKDCGNLDCHRNVNGPNFNPKPTDWIAWIGFENCTEYQSINYKKGTREMSVEKFDKIGYEFTLASGDHDWSDCNFYGEKNGKKTWLGTLASEKTIYGSDEYWTYEDIEDFARKAVAANELYLALDRCDDLLRDVILRIPQLSGLIRVIQSQLEENKNAILKARGKE